MRTNLKFRCPSCDGFVAFWAIRQGTDCPSCGASLESNARVVLRQSIVLGASVAIGTAFLLGDFTGRWGLALFGLELGAVLGLLAGYLFLRSSLQLRASRMQSPSNNRVEPTR